MASVYPKPDGWDVGIFVSSKIRPFVWPTEDIISAAFRFRKVEKHEVSTVSQKTIHFFIKRL